MSSPLRYRVHKVASVVYRLRLQKEVEVTRELEARPGNVILVRALSEKRVYSELELENGRMPIALSLELSERMQMAGWLYWRIYETRFSKHDFARRFHRPLDAVYGKYMRLLSLLGFLTEEEDEIALTDGGAYWLHAVQDLFSIDYIGALWGTSRGTPWPVEVRL